jgi:formylglycine-generating enzyme required for sulfatase activity/CheY-like chemotaxis protein
MRILLVDDDAGVVQALLAILKTLPGHEVRTASNGGEALKASSEMGGLDLLITDVVMEPMDGFTLRDHLVSRYPDTRTILISGFDLSDYPEQTQNHQLLAKPIDAEIFRAAVTKELPPEPVPEPVAEPVVEAAPVVAEVAPIVEAAAVEPTPVEEPAPAPAPVAGPAPMATPAPVVVPTPVPVAKPVAVPVPARPVAAPVAKPAAVPVARPTVVAQTTPKPAAPAQPTPTVRATAVPAPSVPQPTVKAQAVPARASGITATPKAVPASAPTVTAKATAVPRPSAITPSPVATPAPKPTAPTAAPAAASSAAPGQPTVRMAATVRAQPVPPPSAPGVPVPAARPAVVATPAPVAKPPAPPPGSPVKTTSVPTPAPRSGVVQTKAVTPAPAPRATAAPSTVVATPVSAPGTAISMPSFPAPTNPDSGEDLSGQMLGAYQLLRKLTEGRWGGIYAGVQTSINRPVAIEILSTVKAADPAAQARFVADARAKAAVQHPSILAVYEAGEADGRFFYAYEYVDGQSIADLKNAGQRLDEPTALKVLRVAADGLSYFNVHHTPHTPPDASSISIGVDGHPRLANLATQLADGQLNPQEEIQALGRVMLGVLPAIQSLSPGLREMLKRMVQPGPQALTTWGNLLQGIKSIEPKIVPTDAAKISAQDRAAIAAVELARKQQKRSLYYSLGSAASLLLLVGVSIWYFIFHNKQRIFDEQIQIPAGEFLFANGEKKTLPDFWIDKYEVTYGQYADFVKALEARPTTEYDHPLQPRIKNTAMHKPDHWAIFYGNAQQGRAAHSTPIDLSCPMMEVDFWDAYAYAKWKGRELPTEEEWEKAARGTKGNIYPWGEEFDPKKVNSNADYNGNDPGAKGQVDGFNFWNPVDKIKGDKSPFGIIGMAGNVREWTGTWDKAKKRPIVKGGSFMSSDVRLDQRTDLDASAVSEALGFRTVSHTPPTKK